MKKNQGLFIISVIAIIIISLIVLSLLNDNEQADIEKLPALMDAEGAVDIELGDFKLEKQPVLGDADAPVQVIEFIDYKCPMCKRWNEQNFAKFKEELIDTGKVQLYLIHFPFLGPDSIQAALAAETIYMQHPDQFWEFNEILLANQGDKGTIWATEKFLLNLVKNQMTGIDIEEFKKELQNHTYLFNVKEDFKIAAAHGIHSVPTFLVNGVPVGLDYEELRERVEQELEHIPKL